MLTVAFFYGRTPAALWVRMLTRHQGQKFSEVPSHTGIAVMAHFYEVRWFGVRRIQLPIRSSQGMKAVDIGAPFENDTCVFLETMVGKRYDYLALGADALGHLLPAEIVLSNRRVKARKSAGLVLDALRMGGIAFDPAKLPMNANTLYRCLTSDNFVK